MHSCNFHTIMHKTALLLKGCLRESVLLPLKSYLKMSYTQYQHGNRSANSNLTIRLRVKTEIYQVNSTEYHSIKICNDLQQYQD